MKPSPYLACGMEIELYTGPLGVFRIDHAKDHDEHYTPEVQMKTITGQWLGSRLLKLDIEVASHESTD